MKKLKYNILITLLLLVNQLLAKEIYVFPLGNDQGTGTSENPFATFFRALAKAKQLAGQEAVTVWFSEGSYYLD